MNYVVYENLFIKQLICENLMKCFVNYMKTIVFSLKINLEISTEGTA